MKRSLPSMIAGVVLIIIFGLYMITFKVRFSEVAVIRTFGKTSEEDVITEPGLKWKWPPPIQSVSVYDNRIQLVATTGEEITTKDGKNVIVATAIGWRIDNPYIFSITCKNMKDAEGKLKTRVRSDQQTVLAGYKFANFVSTNPQELKYDEIEVEILQAVQQSAKDLYGIEVVSIGIEKLALPERITETVFEAMKKERQAEAARYTSEGESTARQIKDTAEAIAGTIQAFAELKAKSIETEGQRRAAQYFKTFSKDKQLAMFLLKIENLTKMLRERTTLVLDAEQPPFDLLREPEQAPAGSGSTTRPANNQPAITALPDMIKAPK
jgi:membrane protease subunit HflC